MYHLGLYIYCKNDTRTFQCQVNKSSGTSQTFPRNGWPICPVFPPYLINILIPSTTMIFKWSLSFRFIDQNIPRMSHKPRPYHPPCFDHSISRCWRVQFMNFSACSYIHPPVTAFSSVQIFPSTPCSQTPSAYVPTLMIGTNFHIHFQ